MESREIQAYHQGVAMNREFEPRTLEPLTQKSLRGSQPLRPGHSHENVPSLEDVPTKTGVESPAEILAHALSSQTPSLLPLVDRIALAATHDIPLLLTGETGTGKTFLARLIHQYSPRRNHPLLAVPCGAIAGNLIASELFGHTRGAFTSADRQRVGKFVQAGEGTLLLDEIDTLRLEQQATILRVVETGEFEPVGSNETQTCRARLIVASNLDLVAAVASGTFRPDLYYRLNVLSLHLPPLRERVEDIAPLVHGMVARFSRKFRKDLHSISAKVNACLEAFPWPGNIRQLENVIQQAVLVSEGPELLVRHLLQAMPHPPAVSPMTGNDNAPRENHAHTTPRSIGRVGLLREVCQLQERDSIRQALAKNGFMLARTATSLGISRCTLYKKMRKYDLALGSYGKPAARKPVTQPSGNNEP
jgi:DNA-binding NtrC family response regulator